MVEEQPVRSLISPACLSTQNLQFGKGPLDPNSFIRRSSSNKKMGGTQKGARPSFGSLTEESRPLSTN